MSINTPIFSIAKDLNVESNRILLACKKLGINAKGAAKRLNKQELDKIKSYFETGKNVSDEVINLNKTKIKSSSKKIVEKENIEINVWKNKKDINLEKISKHKNNKIKNFPKKRKIELQSYKIILILKDVDPKDPTEELNSILSNSDVNFEIEKIERILDSKSKSMNKN